MPNTANEPKPVELFYSYSHEDWLHTSALEKHLSLLQRRGIIASWHDREIRPGGEWKREIDSHLAEADIVLLMVSSDFLASDYCYEVEMKEALRRHDAGLARVVPVIVRPCDWKGAPFGKLNALPTEGKAINTWVNPDEAYTDVAIGIRKVVEEISPEPITFSEPFRDCSTNLYGLRDNLGKILIPADYDEINEQENATVTVRKADCWRMFDRTGKEILPICFDRIEPFWEQKSLLEISIGARSGVVNGSGEWVVPLGDYDSLRGFFADLVRVGQCGKYGLVQAGEYVIPSIYDRIGTELGNPTAFSQDVTLIEKDGKYGFVNSSGQIICPPAFDWIDEGSISDGAPEFSEGAVHAMQNGFHGFLDERGRALIPFEYQDGRRFREGLIALKQEDKWHYRDKHNVVGVPGLFDAAREFEDSKAEVLINREWFFIDKRGACAEHCPVSLVSRSNSPHLLEVKCRKSTWNKLDVYLRNLDGHHAVIIDKIAIMVLRQATNFVCPGLDPSAEYLLPIDSIGEGNRSYRDISHYIDPGRADRFLINTDTTGVGYVLELTLFFNRNKYVQLSFDY